ncbi:MAG: DUF885 domain-containing protein [Candidatus Hydrogenedentes bacterium]|nr:DUF885 domain-containing protein [Candidatus Hydrogenedentota bacterium]
MQYPEYASITGYPGQDGRWTDNAPEAIAARKQHTRDVLARVTSIPRDGLSASEQLSYDLFLSEIQDDVEGQSFPSDYLRINQLDGVQQSVAETIERAKTFSAKDYENIVARLDGAGTRIRQDIALLREGLAKDITPPRITLRDVPQQILNQIPVEPLESPLLAPFKTLPESFGAATREALVDLAVEAYVTQCKPAFEELHAFVVNEYIPGARDSIALTELPGGEAWYAFNIRKRTTTDMSPQAIHDLGLAEVKRIRAEMDRVIAESGFQGGFAAFTHFLRTDPQFYFDTPEALLAAYRDIAKRVDPELVRLFGILPRLPYGIKPVPAYAEKSQTTAYYMGGSKEAGRPGYFFANTYDLKTRPKWEMEALTLHEAVPGHHLQIALQKEMEDLPEFRKWIGYTAYIEGWGLYAESLGSEMGFYQDPYSKFGQLTYEIWRAIRLVVDTGMHSLGWSRQQAIDYFVENSGKSEHDITVEIDRYIVWPGQALAYKIGELKFKELRARATAALGDHFDIRAFHDVCLLAGPLPLRLLEQRVDAWIGEEQSRLRTATGT